MVELEVLYDACADQPGDRSELVRRALETLHPKAAVWLMTELGLAKIDYKAEDIPPDFFEHMPWPLTSQPPPTDAEFARPRFCRGSVLEFVPAWR